MKTFLIILLAGATAALTIIVRVPIPGTGGYLNFGDIAVIFCGLFLGKKYGALAGGVGSALADVIGGFFIFAPITLVAKGLAGFIAGLIGEIKVDGQELGKVTGRRFKGGFAGKKKLILFLLPLAGLSMVSVYFVAEWLLPGWGLAAALSELPFNLLQAFVGSYIGYIVYVLVMLALPQKEEKQV